MDLDFDLASVQVTEFGVGREEQGDQTFTLVPVDGGVQLALREIAATTVHEMTRRAEVPATYEPAEPFDHPDSLSEPDLEIDGFLIPVHQLV